MSDKKLAQGWIDGGATAPSSQLTQEKQSIPQRTPKDVLPRCQDVGPLEETVVGHTNLSLSMDRQFSGVWIPAEVWLDNRLTLVEKALLAEIDSFTGNGKTFHKCNDTIQTEYGISRNTISGLCVSWRRLTSSTSTSTGGASLLNS